MTSLEDGTVEVYKMHMSDAARAKVWGATWWREGRPPERRSGPGGPEARKQVVHLAQADALTEQGGWSGGGQ